MNLSSPKRLLDLKVDDELIDGSRQPDALAAGQKNRSEGDDPRDFVSSGDYYTHNLESFHSSGF